MQQPIIEIPRANENLVKALIRAGILEVTEAGIKVTKKLEKPCRREANRANHKSTWGLYHEERE